MSHRRIFSQGNVPFSWEEKPGVSKFNHQKIPSSTDVSDKHEFLDLGKPLLPPPPPSAASTPSRRSSSSLKGMIRDDPFMVAFVKCTKNSKTMNNNGRGDHHHHHQRKNSCSVGLSSKKGSRFLFLCKNAFEDVEVDNLMKYSNLPPLPGHKDSIRLHRWQIFVTSKFNQQQQQHCITPLYLTVTVLHK